MSGPQPESDDDFARSLEQLRFHSTASLTLVLLGAGFMAFSVYYGASRLAPLEAELAAKRAEIAQLEQDVDARRTTIAELQRTYDTLKANTEALYSVRVTPSNRVYEVKAVAIATGQVLADGKPTYRFNLLINSPVEVLEEIGHVTYRMDHPTFRQREYVSEDRAKRFAAGYTGWGCLTRVGVTVSLASGEKHDFDFDMCRSLGPEWGGG
jgi:hypothetical protein